MLSSVASLERRPSRPQHARCPRLGRNSIHKTEIAASRPTDSISNRHTLRLEFAVTYSKQSPEVISNRHKFAFSVSFPVTSLLLSSVPCVFQSFEVRLAARTYVQILETNINHSKLTTEVPANRDCFCDSTFATKIVSQKCDEMATGAGQTGLR